jgi:hypothetical protein
MARSKPPRNAVYKDSTIAQLGIQSFFARGSFQCEGADRKDIMETIKAEGSLPRVCFLQYGDRTNPHGHGVFYLRVMERALPTDR